MNGKANIGDLAPKPVSKLEIGLLLMGGLFVLAGVVVIFWGIRFDDLNFRVRAAVWIAGLSLVLWGGATVLLRNRPIIVNCNLAFVISLIIIPIAGELFIRSAIYLEVDFFRNPRLYAGWLDDDDHWKLRHQWGISNEQLEGGGFVLDPNLGWSPPKSPQNPLGILSNKAYTPDFNAKTVLFYGDSYVYGMSPTPIDQRVPQQLDILLPDYAVYNYGVVGYGLDQTFLRFQRNHADFERPLIVIGIYTLDIDRSLLRVRERPKPYFDIEDDALVLKGVPVSDNMNSWLEQHPVTINSYLLAFFVRQYRIMSGGFQITEIPYRQVEKRALNAKIIEAIIKEAKSRDLPLLFVLFYPEWEFNYEGWREAFLKNELDRLNMSYLDTKQLFLDQADGRLSEISKFYDPQHGHLNGIGGKVVAKAIAAYIDGLKEDK